MAVVCPSEKAMAPHSSTFAWKIPWTKEPGRLQSMGSLRVGHDWATSLSCTGEGNGNPLQCSCLENPRDGGTWWTAVCGVAQSRTRLKRLSSSSSSLPTVILEPKKIKSVTASNFSPSICFEMMGPDLSFLNVESILSGAIYCPLFFPGIKLDTFRHGRLIFRCHIFLPFHTVLGFSQQEYWSGLPFPYPVRIIFRWCDKIVYWQFVNRFSHLLILCTFQTFFFKLRGKRCLRIKFIKYILALKIKFLIQQ